MNAEAKKLLNLAFDTYEIYTPELPEDMVKETVVCGGEELSVKLAPRGTLSYSYTEGEHIVWWSAILQQRRKLDAPVKKWRNCGRNKIHHGRRGDIRGKDSRLQRGEENEFYLRHKKACVQFAEYVILYLFKMYKKMISLYKTLEMFTKI